MFAHPIWSVLLILAPIALWFLVIRPRLAAGITEIYASLPIFQRIWALITSFKTFVVALIGAAITAAPDLLVLISPLDFSPWLPQPWPAYTGPITTAIITIMKAFDTKPGESR